MKLLSETEMIEDACHINFIQFFLISLIDYFLPFSFFIYLVYFGIQQNGKYLLFVYKQIKLPRKEKIFSLFAFLMGSYLAQPQPQQQSIKAPVLSFWQLSARDIDQNLIDFHQFEGKKAIILVNVASQSKYTDSNYKQLNEMMQKFKDKGLQILAFPCNQFGCEEGTNEEIKKFVKQKYNVKFLMFEKVLVNTEDLHPVYSFVRENSTLYDPQTDDTKIIEDDFTIFVVNGQGKVVKYFKASQDLTPVRNLIETLVQ